MTEQTKVLGIVGQDALMSLIKEKGEEVTRKVYSSLYKYNPEEFEEYYARAKQNGN